MAERNLLLIGQAEEVDPLLPEVRAMMSRQGVYLASDASIPGQTVPLVVTGGELWCVVLDKRLDPERFLPTAQLAGPFYAPGEEQPVDASGPVLMPACPFCGGPPCPIVARADYPYGAAPLVDEYGDDGLHVSGYVFCHECGADGPKHTEWIFSREDYHEIERRGVALWCNRNSRHRAAYTSGLARGLNTYPRPDELQADTAPVVQRAGYYLASFKHKSPSGGVLWWMPNNSGYTPDLEQAGVYFDLKPGYHDSEHTVPVPTDFIARLRVRRVVDAGDSANQIFWSAKSLREALSGSHATGPVTEVDVDG